MDTPPFPWPLESFRRRRAFETWARSLVRLPRPGEGPLGHLLPEARWQELLGQAPVPEDWLAALSQATGIYFFPSREWPSRLLHRLQQLGVRRLLEAGAGRGYLTSALGPLAAAQGLVFKAVDKGEGEFQRGLAVHPLVEAGDVFVAVHDFRPEAIFYAWPPPGQSLAPLFTCPNLRFLLVAGEPGGGVTGAREDWTSLPRKKSALLSRYCRGRTGQTRHQVTIFGRSVGGVHR